MRLTHFFSLLIISLSLILTSCSPEEDNDNIGLSTGPNTFVANLEGEAWSATQKEALLVDDYLSIYGEAMDGSLMAITVKLFKYEPTNKTYVLDNNSDHFISYDPSSRLDSLVYWTKNNPGVHGTDNNVELQNSGTVIITELDLVNNLVSGEFKVRVYNNFNNSDYYYISQGSFNDISIVDVLSINITGEIINNNGGDVDNNEDNDGDDNDNNGTTPSPQFLNCKIDGVSFNTSTPYIQLYSDYIRVMHIAPTRNMTLKFPATIEVGTYSFTDFELTPQVSYNVEGMSFESFVNTDPGVITVTEKTGEKISGTFSCTVHEILGEESKTISEGSFSVSLLQ
jgi:hypothetical protein